MKTLEINETNAKKSRDTRTKLLISQLLIGLEYQTYYQCNAKTKYEGCPRMPYNCIISFKFKTSISLSYMYHVGNLFLDIVL